MCAGNKFAGQSPRPHRHQLHRREKCRRQIGDLERLPFPQRFRTASIRRQPGASRMDRSRRRAQHSSAERTAAALNQDACIARPAREIASGVTTASTKSTSANSAVDDIRELTPRAIVIGVVLAVILGAANAYLGLYAGLTVSASIPAAVVSMAILRVLGGSTILENNVAQTVASAGEAVAAGAIFTFPALVILGFKGNLPYLDVTALCLAGGTMGSLLVVFLRRAYIVEEKLPFPEGVACAEVLRAGATSANAAPLLYGGIISALLKTSQDIAGLVPGMFSGARWSGNVALAGSFDVS